MKRGVLVFVLVLILCTSMPSVLADDPVDQKTTETEGTKTFSGGNTVSGDPDAKETGDGIQLSDGTILKGFSNAKIEKKGSDVYINGQRYSGAKTIEKKGDGIYVDGAKTVIADGTEDIFATNVGTFQAGPIVITNGVNVKYVDGCLSADSADSLIETDTVATKLDKVSYCDKSIDVKAADSVWAGCVLMEDVKDSKITAGTDVKVEADKGSEFTIKDCATHTFDFTSLSDDSELTLSKNTVNPELTLKDVLLDLVLGNLTESVETNGTALVEVSRIDGIQKVHMTPVTTYTYDAQDPEQDFSVRAWQDVHDLYLKKSATDTLPTEVKDCNACTIADLANHQIEIRGTIDFNKNWLKKSSNEGLQPFFTTANKNAKAILSFDDDNSFVKELLILADAPPYRTYVSNYLTISEAIQEGGTTKRLLDVHEQITKPELTTSWIGSYRTVYSPSTMKVENNVLDYQRNGVVVKVLPDEHKDILALLKGIDTARALVFMSIAGLFAGLFVNKKTRGQLTVFMLIGIVLVAIVGMMLYLVGILSLPNTLHITDKQQVQNYVTECLQMSGKNSLLAFGLQGGHLALQPPYNENPKTAFLYERGNNNLLPLDRMELDIGADTTTRLTRCLDGFKAFTGVTVEPIGSPTVKTVLGTKDSAFTLNYKFFVHKGEQRWDFENFATTVPIGMMKSINAANATVTSEIQNEQQINLDDLPSGIYTFFPISKTLLTTIDGDALFVFANQR